MDKKVKKQAGDFEVLNAMATNNAGIIVSTSMASVNVGKKAKTPGRVAMFMDKEHCQAFMSSYVKNAGKYCMMLLMIDMDEFNRIKNSLENGGSENAKPKSKRQKVTKS